MWTQFFDMHSGGDLKLDWQLIYTEAPQSEAEVIFYNRFGRNPRRVTCTCCGDDYSITEGASFDDLAKYWRDREYMQLIIRAEDIPMDQRIGTVPPEGYVWQS